MVIKAKTPAGFAEKYIIESIWNGRFPPSSILPAERELSELIGVTRTTLREVLQRLSRDGWLTIQHGRPTKINKFMETAGLNILDTLMTLDSDNVTSIVENFILARTSISSIFMIDAFKANKDVSKRTILNAIESCKAVQKMRDWDEFLKSSLYVDPLFQQVKSESKDNDQRCQGTWVAKVFSYHDYILFQRLAFYSRNRIYGLIFNGLKKLYYRVSNYYFSNLEARELALSFYFKLLDVCEDDDLEKVSSVIYSHGFSSLDIWNEMKVNLPKNFTDDNS
ncbi:fatty acid metabolism regulator protein [Candidatus Photodesmus blepharus]|uniref:Fatty acid metabolism regulator protein n=1 Tax=Candidatus Photodesmus blepharonis TaxID=1179155 RepID=A0A084CP47_9GAMM|nr:fatty acid metabolism transcriptional regulator FadR [Candidatus Photodesmus blepharus]KEY91576.1 fatty acid metabolism regulator protein [Candidatus Photodesmus blepharus]